MADTKDGKILGNSMRGKKQELLFYTYRENTD